MINLFCVRTSDKQYISQLFHFEVTMYGHRTISSYLVLWSYHGAKHMIFSVWCLHYEYRIFPHFTKPLYISIMAICVFDNYHTVILYPNPTFPKS